MAHLEEVEQVLISVFRQSQNGCLPLVYRQVQLCLKRPIKKPPVAVPGRQRPDEGKGGGREGSWGEIDDGSDSTGDRACCMLHDGQLNQSQSRFTLPAGPVARSGWRKSRARCSTSAQQTVRQIAEPAIERAAQLRSLGQPPAPKKVSAAWHDRRTRSGKSPGIRSPVWLGYCNSHNKQREAAGAPGTGRTGRQYDSVASRLSRVLSLSICGTWNMRRPTSSP